MKKYLLHHETHEFSVLLGVLRENSNETFNLLGDNVNVIFVSQRSQQVDKSYQHLFRFKFFCYLIAKLKFFDSK